MYFHSAPSLSFEMFMSKMGYELHIRDMSPDFLRGVMKAPRMRILLIITSYGENKKSPSSVKDRASFIGG